MRHGIRFALVPALLFSLVLGACVSVPVPAAPPTDQTIDLSDHELMQKFDMTGGPLGYAEGFPLVIPGMAQVHMEEVVYRTVDGVDLKMLVFYPPGLTEDARVPAVIFPNIWRDDLFVEFAGTPAPEIAQSVYWAWLAAGDGFVAITHYHQYPDDLDVLMAYIEEHADELHIDWNNIGFWTCCASSTLASAYANQPGRENIKFTVNFFGGVAMPDQYLLDVMEQFCKDTNDMCYMNFPKVEAFRQDLPMLVVRAGQNTDLLPTGMIDHFIEMAVAQNLNVTVINYPEGNVSFDFMMAKASRTREIHQEALTFMHHSLAGD